MWTDEQARVLATHPDVEVRLILAEAAFVRPGQRAMLIEDTERQILISLVHGSEYVRGWLAEREAPLPGWAYERLYEREPGVLVFVEEPWWVPAALRDRLGWEPFDDSPAGRRQRARPMGRDAAVELAGDENARQRARGAADPDLPAELVRRLAVDADPDVRLAVSMREELTEDERAAIDFTVGPGDRVTPASWAVHAPDEATQRRAALSGHLGLRRSAAYNAGLVPDLVDALAGDPDSIVRLVLCENHAGAPSDLVVRSYLESEFITSGDLLHHPGLRKRGLARFADDPDPRARRLVELDPDAPPHLIERLSRDPVSFVRYRMAADPRLSPERLAEMFADPSTATAAAANPSLPESLMRRVLDEAEASHG